MTIAQGQILKYKPTEEFREKIKKDYEKSDLKKKVLKLGQKLKQDLRKKEKMLYEKSFLRQKLMMTLKKVKQMDSDLQESL